MAWVVEQFQTPDGAWHEVGAWHGTLEHSDLQFKQCTVVSENADQGPFRWVIFTCQGAEIWGVSDNFYLPGGDGVNLAMTLGNPLRKAEVAEAATATATTPAWTPATTTTAATTVLPVATDDSTWFCDSADSGYGLISVYLPDAPAGAIVAVQSQPSDGTWHNVEAWVGAAAEDSSSLQQAHYSSYPENFGQGPFRWIVAQRDGTFWAIGTEFDSASSDQMGQLSG